MFRSAIVGVVVKKREGGGIGGAEGGRTISRKHHTPAWMFERNRKGRRAKKLRLGKPGIYRFHPFLGARFPRV